MFLNGNALQRNYCNNYYRCRYTCTTVYISNMHRSIGRLRFFQMDNDV